MLIESTFLTLHKWLDIALVTGSYGWNWRPYYQVPKVFNYSYGGQGLHVENVYDPFADTAYNVGPLYKGMMSLVDLVGQGPNPTWIEQRRKMYQALELTNRRLSYKYRPEWKIRSLKMHGYWLKQFQPSLWLQFIAKYLPEYIVKLVEYKIFQPLIKKVPRYVKIFEFNVRKFDYFLANKSLGYHLSLDILEQLNPPIDAEDKITPYDYISIPGKRIIQSYKDFTYLEEMLQDVEREMKEFSDKYNDYVKIAKDECGKAQALNDPMVSRFILPTFPEYCAKFLNVDIAEKTQILIDLKRTINDYRLHMTIPDNVIRMIHKVWFSKTSTLYNNYWKDKYEAETLDDAIKKLNDSKNILEKQTSVDVNPYHISTSKTPYEVKVKEQLAASQRDLRLRYRESLTRLSRDNVKLLKQFLGTDTDPFDEKDEFEDITNNYDPTKTKKYKNRPYHPTDSDFDSEMARIEGQILNEIYTLLPNNIQDNNYLSDVIENYYNERLNQYMYVHYPFLLDQDVKEKLDLKYDKDALQIYNESLQQRIQQRSNQRLKKETVLAPYKVIEKAFDYQHLYRINREDHMVQEYYAQENENGFTGDHMDLNFQGEYIDPERLPYNARNISHARYLTRQQHQYAQMLSDMEKMTKLELEKAKNLTLGTERHRAVNWLERAVNWDPQKRIKSKLPPLLSTEVKNERWSFKNITKSDMKFVNQAFPGLSFEQFREVMDQQDTYQPIKHTPGKGETFEWKGMPRTGDNGYSWKQKYIQQLLEQEEVKDAALRDMYSTRLDSNTATGLEMRHKKILSKEARDGMYQPAFM